MKKLLYISVNSKPEDLSASKTVARKFINKFLQKNKDFQVEEIDLYKEHIPRLEYQYFEKRNCIVNEDDAKKLNDKDQKEVQRIRALCDQFINANVYVIEAPMWSLSFPAPLKEYIDCIMQDQKTKKFEGKKIEPLFGLTCPLLIKADGEKMGKTATGTLWVSREKTSTFEFFQAWMNSFDEDVERSLSFFTRLPINEIKELCQKDIREAKKLLAFEVTKLVHGEEEAIKAKKTSEELFSNNGISDNMPQVELSIEKLNASIVDILLEISMVSSKTEARRLIEQNGISVNKEKVTLDKHITEEDLSNNFIIIQKGKKTFLKVIFK